ncbi:hypothetical protein DENIS_2863 [Desulfonema ishimotonii]|uniref:Uncharacterized protein n=1 Tax=Desulfonema ishimotonii TaxID=45657 RepID=A0A401FY57_9BACT|nr:DUF2845 domain-containing protein [Desulfonema ishimotonii]GBC61901.1 hypothetical protein DENIS_2863 [Desulfonema ishimotonii]
MNRRVWLGVLTFVWISTFATGEALAIRCGNDVIRVGNSALEVELIFQNEQCGGIISKDQTKTTSKDKKKVNGVTTTKIRERVKHEKWLVRIRNSWGNEYYCYELIFDKGMLTYISTPKKCR